ncbi:MAG: hypothetical protein RQ826_06480 [Xanthomonadales bacterium]|nr:hypothetical protein [Xanthomonadales bacterium]
MTSPSFLSILAAGAERSLNQAFRRVSHRTAPEPGRVGCGCPRDSVGAGLKGLSGLAAIIASSELAVVSVVRIAQSLEVSQALVSVLIIGIGTSLPELSISVSAILKKRTGLSVGNIIGSNILDTLLPVGVAAAISPLVFETQFLFFDLPYIFVLTSVVLFFFIRKRGLQTGEAAIILALYAAYAGFKIAQF